MAVPAGHRIENGQLRETLSLLHGPGLWYWPLWPCFEGIRADREVDRRRPVSLLSASRYRVLSGGRAGLPRGFEAGMLAHAREAGGYDELLQRDLISVLRSQEAASVDLLVAADVLIYVLQLDKVFLQAHRVLRKDGIFVFSTETACEAESSEAAYS